MSLSGQQITADPINLNVGSKRKFTYFLDSSMKERNGSFVDRNLVAQIFPDGVAEAPDFDINNISYDCIYKLPNQLSSRTGFFNVSVKSFTIGNTYNGVFGTQTPLTQDPTGMSNLIPTFNDLYINLEVSSPYATSITRTPIPVVPGTTGIDLLTPSSGINGGMNTNPLLGGNMIPIGQVNVFNLNGLTSGVLPPKNVFTYANAAAPPSLPNDAVFVTVGNPAAPHSLNTKLADFSTTICSPDQLELRIVLSCRTLDLEKNELRNFPGLFGYTPGDWDDYPNQPPIEVPPPYNKDTVPFFFPYQMILEFEEV